MALDFTPAHKLISTHQRILLTAGAYPTPDVVAATLALGQWLASLEKEPVIVFDHLDLPARFDFLYGRDRIQELPQRPADQLIVTVNLQNTKVKELQYEIVGDQLRVYLTPQSGQWQKDDVSTADHDLPQTLIISVGAAGLERIGSLFTNRREYFFGTPIINIDNQPDNESYGQVNLVSVSPPSVSEIVAGFILTEGTENKLATDVATNLLTGVIAATHSFRVPTLMPSTLQMAARLLTLGAEHELIMQHLNQNKSLAMLQLWGKALQGLQAADQGRLLFTHIGKDMLHAVGDEHGLDELIAELLVHAPKSLIIAVLIQQDEQTRVYATTKKHLDIDDVLPGHTWQQRYGIYETTLAKPRTDAERELIQQVERYFATN